jgi:hypothetical protein
MQGLLVHVGDEPQQFAGCCLAISKPLLQTLLSTLPQGQPDLILSIGCGSGLLEGLLLQTSRDELNLFGVEVPSCVCAYLAPEKVLRVSGTRSLHPDAILASVLIFDSFANVDVIHDAGLPGHETMVVATSPKSRESRHS